MVAGQPGRAACPTCGHDTPHQYPACPECPGGRCAMGMFRAGGQVAPVRLADAEPVAGFIAEAARAAALFAGLTQREIDQLPGRAARGILVLRQALYALRGEEPPPDPPRPRLSAWPPGYETKDPGVTVRHGPVPS